MKSVRTVSATKAAFFSHYSRPIAAVYRRVIEELLIELHLLTVKSTFVYDPFLALGVVSAFDSLLEGYHPEEQREPLYVALCKALQFKPEILRQDASNLLTRLTSGSPSQSLLLLQQQSEDTGELKGILERMSHPETYTYSRLLLVGLYTAYEAVALPLYTDKEKRIQVFLETVVTPLHFSVERAQKDLELYQSSLERMRQARVVVAEMIQAARRQKERRHSTRSESSN